MRTLVPCALLALLLPAGCASKTPVSRDGGDANEPMDGAADGAQGDGSARDGSARDGSFSTGGDGGPSGFAFGPVGCLPAALEAGISLDGYAVDRYAWSDATCARRSAALVRNDAADPGGSHGAYLRALTWSAEGVERSVVGGSSGWLGFGYVVNHYGNNQVDTSMGHTGSYRSVLAGAHHAIHEFKIPMSPGGPVEVTVHWFFATGRSAPVYAITFDASAASPNQVNADTRAPYGDIPFEGESSEIGGIGWGDTHRFETRGDGPVTVNSAWDYTQTNRVPYTRMWSASVDAEMGLVETRAFTDTVSGGDYGNGLLAADCHGRTSEDRGPNCSAGGETMPQSWLWPYQLNQYELAFTTRSHRLAWGSNYGAVGQASLQSFGRSLVGHPYVSYSVLVVTDPKSRQPTLSQVEQVEHLLGAVLSVSEGTLVSTGPGGVGRSDPVPYAASGYNPTYGVFELQAASGRLTVRVDPQGGSFATPIFHVRGMSALRRVTLDDAELAEGAYFATLDAATDELWLTLNGAIVEPLSLHIE